MHGYCSNLDAMLFRESITPVGEEKSVEILITENAYNIKKVNFEIYEFFLVSRYFLTFTLFSLSSNEL